MKRAIVGFHQDAEGHWVAELACGHGQHVRHDPPWQRRPWVLAEETRRGYLGVELECVLCDRSAAAGRRFAVLEQQYAIVRLAPDAPVPDWIGGAFVSVTRTSDELSIVCLQAPVPSDVRAETGWRVIRIEGPLPLDAVGVLASFTTPLAARGVTLVAIGTFDTDYVLVKAEQLDVALRALEQAGHVMIA